MKGVFKTYITSLNETGAITPSSKHLIRKVIENITFNTGQTIVEFGTGEGCITDMVLSELHEDANLYSFEINDDFYDYVNDKYRSNHNVEIIKKSALLFDEIPALAQNGSIDYFISGLPLSLFKEEDIDRLLTKVKNKLKPNGKYIQYQYSLGKYAFLKKRFNHVDISFTLRNLPPAFVYTCSN